MTRSEGSNSSRCRGLAGSAASSSTPPWHVHRAGDGSFQEALVVLANVDLGHVPLPDLGGRLVYGEVFDPRLGFGDHLLDGLRVWLGHSLMTSSLSTL